MAGTKNLELAMFEEIIMAGIHEVRREEVFQSVPGNVICMETTLDPKPKAQNMSKS